MKSKALIARLVMVIGSIACSAATHAQDLRFVQVASTTNASVSDFTISLNAGIGLAFDRLNRSGAVKGGKLRLPSPDTSPW